MLLIVYRCAFNSTIPSNIEHKLGCFGLCEAACELILGVTIGDHLSENLFVSTGSPQGCILSARIFTLCM